MSELLLRKKKASSAGEDGDGFIFNETTKRVCRFCFEFAGILVKGQTRVCRFCGRIISSSSTIAKAETTSSTGKAGEAEAVSSNPSARTAIAKAETTSSTGGEGHDGFIIHISNQTTCSICFKMPIVGKCGHILKYGERGTGICCFRCSAAYSSTRGSKYTYKEAGKS